MSRQLPVFSRQQSGDRPKYVRARIPPSRCFQSTFFSEAKPSFRNSTCRKNLHSCRRFTLETPPRRTISAVAHQKWFSLQQA